MSGARMNRGPESTVDFLPCDRQISVGQVRGAKVQMLSWRSQSSQQIVALPVYLDEWWNDARGFPNEDIEQVVVHTHGQEREAGRAWSEISAARNVSASNRGPATLLIAPLFFNGLDKSSFGWQGRGSTGNILVWKGNGWGDGSPNQYPETSPTVSSFEAFDALIEYFLVRRRAYPRLRRIVISGHSLGGQLVHRYSVLGDVFSYPSIGAADGQVTVDFVAMNPASYLYFTADRAGPPCQDMNEYKYGFDKLQDYLHSYPSIGQHPNRGAAFYLERLLIQRKVHYLNGMSDKGTGDDRPPAMAQGATRVERARNYYAHLEHMQRVAIQRPDTRLAGWTVDWVPSTGHDGLAMVTSAAGVQRIFG